MKINSTDRERMMLSARPPDKSTPQSITRRHDSQPDSFVSSSTVPKKSTGTALVSARAPIKNGSKNLSKKLSLAFNQQTDELRTLLVNHSREHFQRQVPYIVGVDAASEDKIHFDLDHQFKNRCELSKSQEDAEKNMRLWMKHLSPMRFYAFLSPNTRPIDLGSMEFLEKQGLTSIPIVLSLLTPLAEPEKANVLYLLLAKTKHIPHETRNHFLKALRESDRNEIACIKESILVAAAESESPTFLTSLLKASVSANSLDMNTGFYAINAAQQAQRNENVKILIAHGANPDVKIIQNPY